MKKEPPIIKKAMRCIDGLEMVSGDTLQLTDIATANAKTIIKFIYETHPDIIKGKMYPCMDINVVDNGVCVGLSNDYGVFEFTCTNDGNVSYYQSIWGDEDIYWKEDLENELLNKVVPKHLKRKRLPYNKSEQKTPA